ncbi:zinc finger protein 395a-like [Arapaima gigas]
MSAGLHATCSRFECARTAAVEKSVFKFQANRSSPRRGGVLSLAALSVSSHGGRRSPRGACTPVERGYRRDMATAVPKLRLGKRSPMGALVSPSCPSTDVLLDNTRTHGHEAEEAPVGSGPQATFQPCSRVKLHPGQKVNSSSYSKSESDPEITSFFWFEDSLLQNQIF